MLETKDFSGLGPINSIRWRPNSSELIISGGVNNTNGDTRYFLSYDVVSREETDLIFLSESTVIDMAFSTDGSKMYFIE